MRISDWSSDVCSSDLGPDHPRRMLGPDQAVQINHPQLDLITLRLAQPRPARRPLRTWLLRQILEKPIARHRYPPQRPLRKGNTASNPHQPQLDHALKDSQALRKRFSAVSMTAPQTRKTQ